VRPSDLHTLGYCPRLLFFETHMPRRRGIGERVRLALGRLYHALLSLPLRLRGFRVEEPLEAELGAVLLRGRSDAIALRDGTAVVVERKSGRTPRRRAWDSDILQAAAYGVIALRRGLASRALFTIAYRAGSYTYSLDHATAAAVMRAVDDVVAIRYWGIVGYPRRSSGKCSRCPYRVFCEELDKKLAPPEDGELYEPGSWLEEERLSPPEAQGPGRSVPRNG
jgi:CRISPR-associated exonuclease Cas4